MQHAIYLAALLAIFGSADARPGAVRREDERLDLVASDAFAPLVASGTPIRRDAPPMVTVYSTQGAGSPSTGTPTSGSGGASTFNGPYPKPTSNIPVTDRAPTAKVMIVDNHRHSEYYFDIVGSGWNAKDFLKDNLKQCVKVKHIDIDNEVETGAVRAYGKVKGSGKGSLALVEQCFNTAIQQSGGPANSVF